MIEVRGPEKLSRLSKELKELGNKGLQRELSKAINQATKPLKDEVHEAAGEELPEAGGLAARAARSRLATRRRRDGGVRVVDADRTLSLWHLNAGQVRHRSKNGWGKTQRIRGGFADRAAQRVTPNVQRDLERALDDIGKKLDR